MVNTLIQIAGALLVTIGIGMFNLPIAIIFAGVFTLAVGIARGLK
jgi:uncharacterized membrane-anchored protein YitT (DUF2179 family)|tara:strand:- start:2822 stop:2956 length:135 start_codon:yes stop_codon:yes gene_type:complete